MLRRTVLVTLSALLLLSTAFGSVIWSSSAFVSGQYAATVTETTWSSDYQIIGQSTLSLTGPCGANMEGSEWGIHFDCGASASGGNTLLWLDSGDLTKVSGGVDVETELMVFGGLLVPGTGSTEVEFDMSYDWWVGGATSGWADVTAPVLTLGGSQVPIDFVVTLACHGCGELDTEYLSGKAVTTIQRGTPILFSIAYDSGATGFFGHPSPYITTAFSLDGISEVPEPASIAVTALGLLTLAGWRRCRRRDGARRCN